jgi:hypothetical protein
MDRAASGLLAEVWHYKASMRDIQSRITRTIDASFTPDWNQMKPIDMRKPQQI